MTETTEPLDEAGSAEPPVRLESDYALIVARKRG